MGVITSSAGEKTLQLLSLKKKKKKDTSQYSWSCLNMHQVTENDGYHTHLSDVKRRPADGQACSSETKPWLSGINKEHLFKT